LPGSSRRWGSSSLGGSAPYLYRTAYAFRHALDSARAVTALRAGPVAPHPARTSAPARCCARRSSPTRHPRRGNRCWLAPAPGGSVRSASRTSCAAVPTSPRGDPPSGRAPALRAGPSGAGATDSRGDPFMPYETTPAFDLAHGLHQHICGGGGDRGHAPRSPGLAQGLSQPLSPFVVLGGQWQAHRDRDTNTGIVIPTGGGA
jgi:hypothetical protein